MLSLCYSTNYFFLCIKFSLIKLLVFWTLLKIAETFSSKWFFFPCAILNVVFTHCHSACFCMDFMCLRCTLKAQLLICSGNLAGNCQVLSTPRHFNGKFQLDCLKGVLILFKLNQSFLILSKALSLLLFQVQIQNHISLLLVFLLINT